MFRGTVFIFSLVLYKTIKSAYLSSLCLLEASVALIRRVVHTLNRAWPQKMAST